MQSIFSRQAENSGFGRVDSVPYLVACNERTGFSVGWEPQGRNPQQTRWRWHQPEPRCWPRSPAMTVAGLSGRTSRLLHCSSSTLQLPCLLSSCRFAFGSASVRIYLFYCRLTLLRCSSTGKTVAISPLYPRSPSETVSWCISLAENETHSSFTLLPSLGTRRRKSTVLPHQYMHTIATQHPFPSILPYRVALPAPKTATFLKHIGHLQVPPPASPASWRP